MSTVLLLLDAFRHDYLTEETTPFLWRCAQAGEYYAGVEQSLGFCERSEILTGLRGNDTGFLTAIGFDPLNSPYSKMPWLQFLHITENLALFSSRLLPRNFSARVHEKLRYFVSRKFLKLGITMPTYLIPYSWLPYFALTEDLVDHRNPEAFKTPTIFTLLEEAGRTYCYETFTALNYHSPYRSDCERLDAVLHDIKKSPKDLYLVYISSPDTYGHCYGPESHEFKDVLHRLDLDLERFTQDLEHTAPGNRYLFLGDHGMTTVKKKIDAEKEISNLLRSACLRKGQDVLYFLDSTMVRFWTMSDKARGLLPEVLAASKMFNSDGLWMDDAKASSDYVPWPDRRYGDYLWIANLGVLVFPDFFHHRTPCRGMHGYDPKLPDSRGICIHWWAGIQPGKYPVLPLAGVFDLLKRSLEL